MKMNQPKNWWAKHSKLILFLKAGVPLLDQEDYFEDWRHVLEHREPRPRRRSVDEMQEDEIVIIASPFKKIKQVG
jgi:hypothetical protein